MPVRLPVAAAIALVVLLGSALWGACGGSGDNSSSEADAIPTATLPDPLPEPLIVGEPLPAPGSTTYTVQAGDSLSTIADQFGTTVDAIVAVNDIADPTQLEIGQVLTIPGQNGTTPPVLGATVAPTPALSQDNTYVVQPGDVADSIAAQFGITVEELAATNNLSLEAVANLFPGDRLIIPTPSATATPEPTE